MDKCATCGLERSSHTQLPHRFKSTPPNPDQGVLFDSSELEFKPKFETYFVAPHGLIQLKLYSVELD